MSYTVWSENKPITVNNERELYQALELVKPGQTIAFNPGTYFMTDYLSKLKRIMKLTYRKEKSQRKRR